MADLRGIKYKLINAPAGAGKTTFIENNILDIISSNKESNILAITYTNRAKIELRERIESEKVTIETIHAYLLGVIERYFSKEKIIDMYFEIYEKRIIDSISLGEGESKNQRYKERYGELTLKKIKENIKSISYNEQSYSSYYYGRISHDDLLLFARVIFSKYDSLKKRLTNKYSFIFIDEYQDTAADVLHLFYEATLLSDSHLYLFGDKMQEIYDNYDGSFEEELNAFDSSIQLRKNYRCSATIVKVLNNLYNEEEYYQSSYESVNSTIPKVHMYKSGINEIDDEIYDDYLMLYIFNRKRFEKIGAGELYNSLSKMKSYKFPSKYSPVDVLTGKSKDNPDKLFRILFMICEFVKMIEKNSFGSCIRMAKSKQGVFCKDFTKIETHTQKIDFSMKLNCINEEFRKKGVTIKDYCDFIVDNGYCMPDTFKSFIENEQYNEVMDMELLQVKNVYKHMLNPKVSTQHGVKGEGHKKVCLVVEDSSRNPITYMYRFLELFCKHSIKLTEFQAFYYGVKKDFESINLEELKSKTTYEVNEGCFIEKAVFFEEKYKGNKYYEFCIQNAIQKYLSKPNVTNARECFKISKVRGTLWAYKLFYVGCSRAKSELIVVIDENKISSFKNVFIKKMECIGFSIKEKS